MSAAPVRVTRLRVRGFPHDRYKSELEREWALVLESMKRDGTLLRYDYEPEKLRIGEGAYYTPDFRLVWADGEVTFDECKGFRREAAIVRIKVAADQHPYRFRLVRRGKRGEKPWVVDEVST